MRLASIGACLWLACSTGSAQKPPSAPAPSSSDSGWRRGLTGLPEQPSANTSVQDANQFAQNVESAVPYFATLTPGDYEANRELIRRMWAYSAALDVMAGRNPQMRLAAGRARRALGAWGYGASGYGAPGYGYPFVPGGPEAPERSLSQPPPPPSGPPFATQAPLIEKIPANERTTADELRSRYETSAARAAAAWQNAEVLRQNLAREGLSLNTQTAASLARLQVYFGLAAGDLQERDWAEAQTNLDRAEYETNKVFQTVGR
jgi:hypothetical protein